MKTYEIINTLATTENCRPIVIATSYKDPLEDINLINQIENDLRALNIPKR